MFATSKLDRTAYYYDWQLWSQFPYCRTAFSKWEFSAPSSPILDYYFGYFWMSGCTVMVIWSFSSDFLVWERKEMANLSFNTFLGWRRGTSVQPDVLRSKWFVSFLVFFFLPQFWQYWLGDIVSTVHWVCLQGIDRQILFDLNEYTFKLEFLNGIWIVGVNYISSDLIWRTVENWFFSLSIKE